MPLQTSGAISLNQIHVEAGGTSGTTCSINDSDIRSLSAASGYTIPTGSGTTIDFGDFYGASSAVTLVAHGYLSNTGSNALSYSGSFSASCQAGDTVVMTYLTGYGSSSNDTIQINSGNVTGAMSGQIWSSGFYSKHGIYYRTLTASASSVSLSVTCPGSTNRTGMWCYGFLLRPGVSREDTASWYGNYSSGTVDTGEVGAFIVGQSYTSSSYSMPGWSSSTVDSQVSINSTYHAAIGWKRQTDTSATHSFSTTTTGSSINLVSFTKT